MDDLERLSIIEDIRNLMARYAHYADDKRWSDLAALFTADGTFSPLRPDGSVLTYMTGRKNIAEMIGARVGDAQPIHHLFSYEIDVTSPTSACATWAMEDLVSRPDTVEVPAHDVHNELDFKTLHGYGHYHGSYVKVDGSWLIAELRQTRLRLDFTY